MDGVCVGEVTRSIFDQSQLDILHMMSADSYVRFRRSPRFEEYLK
jgi:hypothetical protein